MSNLPPFKKKKGGKLRATEVRNLLDASYQDEPPQNIGDWVLDNGLSNQYGKVYYKPDGSAVVAHRGTDTTLKDWGNNLAYAMGNYENTDRYKQGKSIQDQAESKYGAKNISTLGHSQGSILSRKLGKNTKEIINVNPAYRGEVPLANEYNVRSSKDVVSSLYAPVSKISKLLYPTYTSKHSITVPTDKSFDVLGNHSYEILNKLGDQEIGDGRQYPQLRHSFGGSNGTQRNLFATEPASLREQIIRQTSTPQLQEWLIFTTDTDQYDLSQMISREINGRQALLAQNAPRVTNRKNLFGKGKEGKQKGETPVVSYENWLKLTGATPEEIATEFPNFITATPEEENNINRETSRILQDPIYSYHRDERLYDRLADEYARTGKRRINNPDLTDMERDAIRYTILTEDLIPPLEDEMNELFEKSLTLDENSAEYNNITKRGRKVERKLLKLKREENSLHQDLLHPERAYQEDGNREYDSDSEGSVVF
jgi:hypothetical protein